MDPSYAFGSIAREVCREEEEVVEAGC